MCQRNRVMILAFTTIVNRQGRSRCSHRSSLGLSNITAPMVQTPPSRKHTVGG